MDSDTVDSHLSTAKRGRGGYASPADSRAHASARPAGRTSSTQVTSPLLYLSGLQQLVLHLDVSVQQPVLCQEVYGLQQLVLHLDWLSTWACAAHMHVGLQELLYCSWAFLSTRAYAALMHDRLQECMASRACTAKEGPVRIQYKFLIWNLIHSQSK